MSVASHTLRFDGACTFARSDVNGIAAAAVAAGSSSVVPLRSVPFVRRFVRSCKCAQQHAKRPAWRVLGHTAATVSWFLYL